MSDVDISLVEFKRFLLGVKSKATAQRYPEYAAKFLQVMKASGCNSFADMPAGMLSEFAAELSRAGNSPSTVRLYTFATKKYLNWVERKGVLVNKQFNPELPKVHLTHREVLPPEMFTRYFRQADLDLREPTRTAVMLLPCCGLRGMEMVSLKLDQIHKSDVKLKTGKTTKTLFFRFQGKGGKERSVPLMTEGVEILTGYLAGWRKRQKGPWLFPADDREKHLGDRYLRHAVHQLQEPLGISFTPHTMRRTYITNLWRKGVDLSLIANIAGHENVQTTIDHYLSLEPDDALKAFHNAGGALT